MEEIVNETQPTPIQEEAEEQKDDDFFGELDGFLNDIGEQLSILDETDDLIQQIESAQDSYDKEIMGADDETKREMARTALDAYTINLLARDKNFFIRILALCNEAISPAVLKQTVEDVKGTDKYTLKIIAHNSITPRETLERIFDFAGDEEEIREEILNNPNCDDSLRSIVNSSNRSSNTVA